MSKWSGEVFAEARQNEPDIEIPSQRRIVLHVDLCNPSVYLRLRFCLSIQQTSPLRKVEDRDGCWRGQVSPSSGCGAL